MLQNSNSISKIIFICTFSEFLCLLLTLPLTDMNHAHEGASASAIQLYNIELQYLSILFMQT